MNNFDPFIIELIQNVGFPIFAFLLIYVDLRKEIIKLRESIETLLKATYFNNKPR